MPTFNTTPNHKIVLNYFFIMHRVASNCQALVQILRNHDIQKHRSKWSAMNKSGVKLHSVKSSYKTPSNKIYEFVKLNHT